MCVYVCLSIWSWPNGPSVLALLTENQWPLGLADTTTSCVEKGRGTGGNKGRLTADSPQTPWIRVCGLWQTCHTSLFTRHRLYSWRPKIFIVPKQGQANQITPNFRVISWGGWERSGSVKRRPRSTVWWRMLAELAVLPAESEERNVKAVWKSEGVSS